MLSLSARLPADEGAILVAALEQARAGLIRDSRNSSNSADQCARATLTATNPAGVAGADAVVDVARRALASGDTDTSGDDRHLVVVHVDAAALAADPGSDPGGPRAASPDTGGQVGGEHPSVPGPRCHLDNGPGLDRRTAARIACDAALLFVIHQVGEGEPLRLGRKTRQIAPTQRRALRIRDGGCVFPGCHRRRHLNVHHVQPWSLGGRTDLGNLALLCRFHHMLLHEGGYTITSRSATAPDGSQWLIADPDGREVPIAPPLPGCTESFGPASLGWAEDSEGPSDRRGLLPAWRGEPFHLAETVAVLANHPRKEASPPAELAPNELSHASWTVAS